MRSLITIFISAVLLLGGTAYRSFNGDCMNLFKNAFGKIENLDSQSNKGLSINYVVTVQTATGETYSDHVDMTIFNKKSTVKSNDVTVYQDAKTMVAITPGSNTIFMNRPVDQAIKKTKFQNIIKLQDSIFSKMILKSCVTETIGLHYKKLVFQFPPKVQNKLGLNAVTYWINEEEVSVRKLQLEYTPREGQPLNALTMEFIHLDTNYSKPPFEGSALSKVFDGKNSLKAIYKNYTVVDKR